MAQEIVVPFQIVIPKAQKMVLNASLSNTRHYKVHIKGKVEQSRMLYPLLHIDEVAIEKRAFGLHLTMVANFIYTDDVALAQVYTCSNQITAA